MLLKTRILALAIMALTIVGCSGVENLSGVELATAAVSPTQTPAPTATPDPSAVELLNSTTKEFLGTTITLSYPAEWERDEGGQSLNLWDGSLERDNAPGVGLFISLLRSVGIEDPDGPVAALAMQRFLGNAAEGGFVAEESAPGPDDAISFTWGDHDAAIFAWQSTDATLTGVNITVIDSKSRRMVLFGAQAPAELWADYAPTWQAILGTVVLDGDPLPLADLLTALVSTTS